MAEGQLLYVTPSPIVPFFSVLPCHYYMSLLIVTTLSDHLLTLLITSSPPPLACFSFCPQYYVLKPVISLLLWGQKSLVASYLATNLKLQMFSVPEANLCVKTISCVSLAVRNEKYYSNKFFQDLCMKWSRLFPFQIVPISILPSFQIVPIPILPPFQIVPIIKVVMSILVLRKDADQYSTGHLQFCSEILLL